MISFHSTSNNGGKNFFCDNIDFPHRSISSQPIFTRLSAWARYESRYEATAKCPQHFNSFSQLVRTLQNQN
jgi:hypothetical protein